MLYKEELKQVVTDPKEIVEGLDKYVIGQEAAKKALALMLFNRSLMQLKDAGELDTESSFNKTNVLLIGQSGSGKTHLLKTLAKISDAPISFFDVTSLTSSGYQGEDVEDIILNHIIEQEDWVDANYHLLALTHGYSIEEAKYFLPSKEEMLLHRIENGVIYLDEIDKIRAVKRETGKDVSGDALQSELLKLLEDGIVTISGKQKARKSRYDINMISTKNISFVCGGAFKGLTDLIKDKKKVTKTIGFNSELLDESEDSLYSEVDTDDLVEYGFKKEFVGRLHIRACLNKLTLEDLVRIIKEPKDNVLNKYTDMFRCFGINVEFVDGSVEAIAKHALALKTGARSLQQIFLKLFSVDLHNIYHLQTDKIVVDGQYVKDRLGE